MKSLQSCPTLCEPIDCSPLGSSVHGILQARMDWQPWSGLPCLPPGDLLDPGIEPVSFAASAFQADSLLLSHPPVISAQQVVACTSGALLARQWMGRRPYLKDDGVMIKEMTGELPLSTQWMVCQSFAPFFPMIAWCLPSPSPW